MTIGLLLLAGLSAIFISSSDANRELQKSAQQLENGRYAIQLISQDLQHAGSYGQFSSLPAVPGALPAPCTLPTAATAVAYLNDSLPFAVQGEDSPAGAPTMPCISDADHLDGTDILVVRRANTTALAVGETAISNEVYIQSNPGTAAIQLGAGAAITNNTMADGATVATIRQRIGGATPAAEIRKYRVHIYFVAPNNVGTDGIPTLKRLELRVPDGGGALGWQVVSLVEGIENLQVDYGIDDAPAIINTNTGQIGDGAANCYSTNPAGAAVGCTAAAAVGAWANVVTAKIHLIARNTEATKGYTDTKQYNMGLEGDTAVLGGEFKRHAYSTQVRLVNVSARREYQ